MTFDDVSLILGVLNLCCLYFYSSSWYLNRTL